MIVLVSLIEGDFLVSTIFRMVHPIPTSLLNDSCTCSTFFDGSRINATTCMHTYVG